MSLFLEMLIYIIAIIGIIFTTMTFCEVSYTKRKFESIYELICNNSNSEKTVNIKITTTNLDKFEILKLKEIIENGNYNNIYELVDDVDYSKSE